MAGLQRSVRDVVKLLGEHPGGEEMDQGPPAFDRRRDVRMSAVQVEDPDSAGQVCELAPKGSRSRKPQRTVPAAFQRGVRQSEGRQ
jgi:hypothetical protein